MTTDEASDTVEAWLRDFTALVTEPSPPPTWWRRVCWAIGYKLESWGAWLQAR